MKEQQIFEQFKLWRSWTVESLKHVSEEEADCIPELFRNNIRWNAGHILAGWDHTVSQTLKSDRRIPEHYHILFPRESSPEDWSGKNVPTMEELIEQLTHQPDEIIELCSGKLDNPLAGEFFHMKTLGDMFLFHMNHEALHMSTINTLKRHVQKELVK